MPSPEKNITQLIGELEFLIEDAKMQTVSYVNSTLTVLYWHIGKHILQYTLGEQRAEYGKQVVSSVANKLVDKFGKSYEVKNLRRMIPFAKRFPDLENEAV